MDPHEVGRKWVFEDMWEFTSEVPIPVILDYFKACMVCANADGELSDPERAWCVGYCAALGATPDTLAELEAYAGDEDVNAVIDRASLTGIANRPLAYDSIRACSADGELSEGEHATIRKMAAKMGVTDDELAELVGIYADERALRDRRIKVCFPQGTPF